MLAELAADLGADVPSQLDPAFALVGGAGEAVEPLPPPGEFAAVLLPAENGLRTADVYAEADRLGLGRDLGELDAIAAKLRAAAAGGASPLDYPELLVNDLGQAALSLRPEIARVAHDAAGGRGCGGAGRGVGPHGLRAVRGHRRRRPGRRGAAASPRERDRGGARGEPMSANGDEQALAPSELIVVALVDRRRSWSSTGCSPTSTFNRRCRTSPRAWAISPTSWSGLGAFLETGAFVGLVLPGETVVILGGAVAGQGETSIVLTIGVVWAAALAGDSVSFLLGRRLGREFLLRHGPKAADHAGALRLGRELLRAARGKDDRDRALHRLGPGAGAVHRGQLGDAVRLLPAVQRARHRPVGGDLRADRLLRLAEPRRGGACRRPGHAPVRDRGGRDRRDRGRDPLPAPAREPRAAGGGDGATRRPSSAARGGAAGGATGALPVGPADAREAGARVHHPARRPRRQPLRGGGLHGGRLGRPGADAGRPHGVRCRRSPARGLGHGRRQDRHRARLRRRQRAAGGDCGAAPGGAAALGRGRRAGCGRGDHLHRGGGAQGRDRRARDRPTR